MDKIMQTLLENFEGFSQIFKEQSGGKRYLGVFTISTVIINMKTFLSKAKRKKFVK